MESEFDISRAIAEGNAFFQRVMESDAHEKRSVSIEDLERKLSALLMQFVRTVSPTLEASIAFGNVHEKMRRKWHTELTYVELEGQRVQLHFDTQLAGAGDRHSGLIFVAKSWVLILVIVKALSIEPELTGNFVFEIGDNATLGEVGFTSTKPDACLIMDFDFAAADGYRPYRAPFEANWVPWERRIPRVFWRGSTTGRRLYDPPPEGARDRFTWLPRLALCRECREPDLAAHCDVGITQFQQMPEKYLQERITAAGFLREPVPRQHFMNYRGVFDIDGNCNAWSGLFLSLLGGSCVLKVESQDGFREWYYDRLVPWENYIPVKSDLSDLPEAVAWFVENDGAAALVAAQGRELAKSIDARSALLESAENLIRWLERRAAAQQQFSAP